MTDLVITAANVVAGSGAQQESGVAGVAITAGQMVYLDPADSKYKLADNDSPTVAARSPRGLALNNAAANQPLVIVRKGPVTLGTGFTPGAEYYLSATAGGMCPLADLGTGKTKSFLGMFASATSFVVNIQESGVTL